MPQVTTGFAKAISGNPVNNNGATVLNGGNAITTGQYPNVTKVVSLPSVLSTAPYYGSKLHLSVSPGSSGNVGHGRAFTTAVFGNFGTPDAPNFIMSKVTTLIAGASNTLTQSMAADTTSRRPIGRFYDYQRRSLTISQVGIATKGANDGVSVLASGIDGTTGLYADKAVGRAPFGVPYKFTIMYGNIQASGVSRTSATSV